MIWHRPIKCTEKKKQNIKLAFQEDILPRWTQAPVASLPWWHSFFTVNARGSRWLNIAPSLWSLSPLTQAVWDVGPSHFPFQAGAVDWQSNLWKYKVAISLFINFIFKNLQKIQASQLFWRLYVKCGISFVPQWNLLWHLQLFPMHLQTHSL